MQLRRTARLLAAAGALLLAAPVLSSCGFDYATDRVYTPGTGTNDQDTKVDVLGSVVVSAEEGSGTLVTTFANNKAKEPEKVTAIAGAGDDAALKVEGFTPIELAPGGYVNLADADTPVTITGDFGAGDFLTLEFTFGDGSTTRLDIPAVADCYEYSGLDKSAETPTPADECKPAAVEIEE
ncbi:hypothetical protein [Nocardioides sp. URHA0020]|uniref:hypothetical protein n=1 Tax=Nocardioides sp. URHA0020 TaxID=1380392 RepID=UPI0012DC90EB|nr:hypothetical protein [Nocardioides sp. URHA0020]